MRRWLNPMIRSGEILRLSRSVVRPYYESASRAALECLRETFRGLRWQAHLPEGAFFLWLRFPALQIPSWELYERLKARGVFVLSGHHFFPDCASDPQSRQCLRVNYAQPPKDLERGLQVIAEEVRALG